MIHLFHSVAAFLLAVVGYSAGTVLAMSGCRRQPRGWELLVAGVAAAAAALQGLALLDSWLALPAALASGGALGLLAGLLGRQLELRRTERTGVRQEAPSEFEQEDRDRGDGSALRRFLRRMGNYQGRLMMGFLYFGLLTPFGLVSRLADDPLRLDACRATYWRDATWGEPVEPGDDLRSQT